MSTADRALELARRLRKRSRELERSIFSLSGIISELAERVDDLNDRMIELEDEHGGNGSGLPFYPDGPQGLVDLHQYVIYRFGEQFLEEERPEMKTACGKIRDALALDYPGIERVNDQGERHDYAAADEKHRDAIILIGETPADDVIIDFCVDSTGPGTLAAKLQWAVPSKTPWS